MLKAQSVIKCLSNFTAPNLSLKYLGAASIGFNGNRVLHSGATEHKAVAPSAAVAPAKEFSELPGPPHFPIIGAAATLALEGFSVPRMHVFYEKQFKKFGPIFKQKLPGLPMMVVTINAEDVETMYKSTADNPTRDGFESLKKVRRDTPNNYFGEKGGILIENGDEWWRVRSKVQGPLMKPKNVAMYLPKVDEATLKFMDRVDVLQRESGGVIENFQEELYKWALECVGLVALDKELGCLEPNLSPDSTPMKLIEQVNIMFEALAATEMSVPWWKFFPSKSYSNLVSAHSIFLELADKSIQESLDSLKKAQEIGDANRKLTVMETFLNTEGLNKTDVTTMVLDMLFAGIDTTSHTLAFCLYLLAKHPDVQQKLHAEIERVMGDSSTLEPHHISEMVYLNRVLKESLRLFPIALANGRIITKEIEMSGYKIPVGSFVLSFHNIMSRDEKYFKKPDEFIPERWNRDKPLGEIHPYASLPFSTGTRMCIGKRLAEQEIYNFLIRALQKYRITFESPQEMEVKINLVLKPAIPLPFKFHLRK